MLVADQQPWFIVSDEIRRWCVRRSNNRTGAFSYLDLAARVRVTIRCERSRRS